MAEPNYIEIGTKEFSFTILNINPQKNLLPLTININGLSFGTLDSPTYMPSFIGDLKALVQGPFHKNYNLTIENFLENLCINQELIEHYILTLEETFDDFSKLGFGIKNPFFSYLSYIKIHFYISKLK